MNKDKTWIAVLDIVGLTADEYDSIVRTMGVEHKPAPDIYIHLATPMEGGTGIRVIELWNNKEGFESFIQQRMIPAATGLGVHRETKVSVTPLLNAFAPRLNEIVGLPQLRKRPTTP